MTIVDKLKAEEGNLLSITVHGNKSIFANAYERSAFALIKTVKKLQTRVLYNDKLKMRYVAVGIPANNVEKYLKGAGYTVSVSHPDDGTTLYVAKLKEPLFSEEEFLEWKNDQLAKKADPGTTDVIPESVNKDKDQKSMLYESVINDILEQQLSEYTPMMALNYLSNLQKRIRDDRL